MKRSELFFGAALVPIDIIALLAAGALAYYLRISSYIQQVRPALFVLNLPFPQYMQIVGLVTAFIILVFAAQGLYAMQVTRRAFDEFTRIFAGISMGIMTLIIVIFLQATLFNSRFIVLAAYLLAVVLVAFGRYIVRSVQKSLLKKGFGVHRVALVGNGPIGRRLDALFTKQPQLGYRIVSTDPIARWDLLENTYQNIGIDEIIQTDPTLPEEDNAILLDFCEQYKIDYKYIPNMFETHASHVVFRQLGGIPMMELARTPLEGWGRIAKRIVDFIGGCIGMILLSPILLGASLAIRLNSKGPIFYWQLRVGKNKKPFKVYKFRSMFVEYCVGDEYGGQTAKGFYATLRQKANERTGPLFKMKNDPRITAVGRILRRTRIDELPQLWNVVRGDMSLFGPRPHLPEEVEQYGKYQQRLFTIKPGMSGMAQVSGNAGLSFEDEAKLDIYYIEHWTLWLDFTLLVKTLRILFTDKNAV